MIAEARIWNRPLSADEINAENHFYKVSPSTRYHRTVKGLWHIGNSMMKKELQ